MDQKTSILINRQVPEYVREEYPIFISFLEAYYEFLETKQGEQKNDLIKISKDLKNISDVDLSIEEFENQFFNTFANLIPKDALIDKATLIKNVLPLYLSKGSEKSFKLLFRLLFGQELEVSYPKNDVLRASDGKWLIENVVKITDEVFTTYIGNGSTKQFKLAPCKCPITNQPLPINVTVFIDGVLQSSGFFVRRESKKLIFNVAPSNNSEIKIFYKNFDFDTLINRQVTGIQSNATAIVEKISNRIINVQRVIELYVSEKNLIGDFSQGENLLLDVIVDDDFVNVTVDSLSSILSINVIDGGSSYNVGDPVLINSVGSEVPASAIISKVFSGTINRVDVLDGGAGFEVAAKVEAIGVPNTALDMAIATVNTTGFRTSNTFTIFSDIISDVDPANTILNSLDWNFPSSVVPSENLSTVIAHSFANVSYTSIGEIDNVSILLSTATFLTSPELNAEPAKLVIEPQTSNTSSNISISIDTFGSLGKLVIVSAGQNYDIGDEIIFTNQPMTFGLGAEAEVTNVTVAGAITEVQFVPSKITGTANVTSVSNVMVQGNSTLFEDELIVGDKIMIGNEVKTVVEINSNTSINVDSFFSEIKTEKPIRLFGKNLLGGQGYTQDKLPTTSISSLNGVNGNVIVTAIMGDGENLLATGTKRPGEIEEITVTNPGVGFVTIPKIDLTQFGDGTAVANASLSLIYESLLGRWTSSDSILSSVDRKLQGRNYYVNYSYLLSSSIEFSKYKKIFKDLLHPVGFREYAEWKKLNEIETESSTLDIITAPKNIRTLSGKVNIANSSIYVTGVGTKFNIANNLGIITIGSYIAINSEIRIVDSIISNTNLAVTSAFTTTANLQEMLVVNTVYEAIATEVTLNEIIAENELVLTVES
jgi:hypothetical protein